MILQSEALWKNIGAPVWVLPAIREKYRIVAMIDDHPTITAINDWLRAILPFFATVLSGINTWEAIAKREKRWRIWWQAAQVLFWFGLGCFLIYSLVHHT